MWLVVPRASIAIASFSHPVQVRMRRDRNVMTPIRHRNPVYTIQNLSLSLSRARALSRIVRSLAALIRR